MVFCLLRGLTAKSCYAAKHWDCFLSYCDNLQPHVFGRRQAERPTGRQVGIESMKGGGEKKQHNTEGGD